MDDYTRYFPGDHGAAIQAQYYPSIANFILIGENTFLELPGSQNGRVVLLSKLTILVWLILVGVIAGIGWLIFACFAFLIVLLFFI